VFKIHHPPAKTKLISTVRLGQPEGRGFWATAALQDGRYGVLLGRTRGENSSLAVFLPETQFDRVRQLLPADYREVFEEAARRLPGLKARTGSFNNALAEQET
jgi:hypothetical protein